MYRFFINLWKIQDMQKYNEESSYTFAFWCISNNDILIQYSALYVLYIKNNY